MLSNAQRGAYYKTRSRKWLQSHGYQVADLEVVKWLHPPGRSPIPVKRDQFGSDLIAVSGSEIVFVQVKGGESARGGTFPAARREFAKFTFPPFSQQWVLAWAPRAREPRIVKCGQEMTHGKVETVKANTQEGIFIAHQGRGYLVQATDRAIGIIAQNGRTFAPQSNTPRHGASAKRATRPLL